MSMGLLIAGLIVSSGALLARDCTPVDGDRLTGRELAAADPSFSSVPETLDLGPAPMPMADRIFRVWELANLERKLGVQRPASAATQLCFHRSTQTLVPERLDPILRAALSTGRLEAAMIRVAESAGDGGEPEAPSLQILDYSRNPLPLGELQFRAENLTVTGLWTGRVLYGEGRSSPIWVRVAMNKKVSDANPSLPSAGTVVTRTASSLSPPDVERGQEVHVLVSSGALHMGFDAEAQSSGRIGESIVLRNPANGRRFKAVVKGLGQVEVRP